MQGEGVPHKPPTFEVGIRQPEMAYWASMKAAGLKAIPPVTAGWDPRPRQYVPPYPAAGAVSTRLGRRCTAVGTVMPFRSGPMRDVGGGSAVPRRAAPCTSCAATTNVPMLAQVAIAYTLALIVNDALPSAFSCLGQFYI